MKRLTKVGLAVAIAGMVLLLKGSSPLVTTAIAKVRTIRNKRQKNQHEMHRRTPPPTGDRQFVRISPQKA